MGPTNVYTYFNCAYWPVPATRTPGPVVGAGAPPILVIASTGDPATPYIWGQALADQLESAILVTRHGDGHTSMRFSFCVREIVTDYVVNLAAPITDANCT
jgi:hypothetical protein